MQDALNAFLAERPKRPVSPSSADAGQPPPPALPATVAVGAGKEQLITAYDRLVEHEATKPRRWQLPTAAKWKRFIQPAIITTSVVAMGYLWLGKPGWLYPTVDPIDVPTTQLKANQTLVATSLLVQDFQRKYGRLPSVLSEVGVDIPSVSILADSNGGFRLVGGLANRPGTIRVVPGFPPVLEAMGR